MKNENEFVFCLKKLTVYLRTWSVERIVQVIKDGKVVDEFLLCNVWPLLFDPRLQLEEVIRPASTSFFADLSLLLDLVKSDRIAFFKLLNFALDLPFLSRQCLVLFNQLFSRNSVFLLDSLLFSFLNLSLKLFNLLVCF